MFNSTAFMKAKYIPRMEDVPVKDLSMWFDKDEEPVWKVRGLTASEMAVCNEAALKSTIKRDVVEAISSTQGQVDAIRDTLGLSTANDPAEIIKRMQQLVLGSVSPEVTHAIVVQLSKAHPVEFYQLTNKITVLTGQGMDLEKSKPSGKT